MNSKKLTIVITGATKGLGKALAEEYIQLGHNVIGCGRDAASIQSLSTIYEGKADFHVVDISSYYQVQKWSARVLKKYRAPDLLINNAGIINKNAFVWEVPQEEFSSVIDVNIKGTYHTIKLFVPSMIKSKNGIVVNFSSGWRVSSTSDDFLFINFR